MKIVREILCDKLQNNLKMLKVGSMFHDIGKISTPNSILLKNGHLTENEYFQIKHYR